MPIYVPHAKCDKLLDEEFDKSCAFQFQQLLLLEALSADGYTEEFGDW